MSKKQTKKKKTHDTENTYSKSNSKPYSEQRLSACTAPHPKSPTLLMDITAGCLEGRRAPELF